MFRALTASAAVLVAAHASAAAGELWVTIDTLTRHQIPDGVGRIVVTNPAVADVEVATANELMFFGRMPGFTDVVLQDADGKRLSQFRVRVGNERRGVVTLYNGAQRYSFSCTATCEQTPVIGDGRYGDMQQVIAQAQLKASAARAGGGFDEEAFEVSAPQRAPEPSTPPLPRAES